MRDPAGSRARVELWIAGACCRLRWSIRPVELVPLCCLESRRLALLMQLLEH